MTTDQSLSPRPAIVNIDDVRATLETLELDARKTNASVIQKALGRGGMGTVQKHLDALRAELDRPAVVLDGEIPAAPRETMDAIWRSAWTAAQAHTAAGLASALLERDQARGALESARADVDVWTASAEAAETAAEVATAAEAAAVAAAEAARIALEASEAEKVTDAAAAADSAAKASTNAAAAAVALQAQHDLTIAHAETRIATLQGQLDRVNDQLAEVKSLLPRNTMKGA